MWLYFWNTELAATTGQTFSLTKDLVHAESLWSEQVTRTHSQPRVAGQAV